MSPNMNIGSKVIITFNPHHKGADKIIGTIRKRGEVVCGSQLYYVKYKNPVDGQIYTMPIGHHNLQATSEANLIEMADYHESLAAEFRHLAQAAKDNQ